MEDKLKQIINGTIYYHGVNLKDLAVTHGTPLKVTFLDVIKDRVVTMKDAFDRAIKETDYKNKFIYLNANKANYGALEIQESFKYGDGLETSSYYDLLLTFELFKRNPEYKDKFIVCNGNKQKDYLDEIIVIKKSGYNIIDVIDSKEEYEYLKEQDVDLDIGLRIHLLEQYNSSEDEPHNDRFGLTDEDFDYIINDIQNSKLNLTMIHFHQRGKYYHHDKFEYNFKKVFEKYYVSSKKKFINLNYYNIGGGAPCVVHTNVDYNDWAKSIISLVKSICRENNIEEPAIICENGRYTQKDATINIYKVIAKKYTDEYPWYFIDGGFLVSIPEFYVTGEPFDVTAINDLDKEKIKVRLGGNTCDCDDIYMSENGYFEVPNSDELYIGILGTGSYQNSVNGKGGYHHCLLPQEKDIVLYTENNELKTLVRSDLQSIEEIFKLLKL